MRPNVSQSMSLLRTNNFPFWVILGQKILHSEAWGEAESKGGDGSNHWPSPRRESEARIESEISFGNVLNYLVVSFICEIPRICVNCLWLFNTIQIWFLIEKFPIFHMRVRKWSSWQPFFVLMFVPCASIDTNCNWYQFDTSIFWFWYH